MNTAEIDKEKKHENIAYAVKQYFKLSQAQYSKALDNENGAGDRVSELIILTVSIFLGFTSSFLVPSLSSVTIHEKVLIIFFYLLLILTLVLALWNKLREYSFWFTSKDIDEKIFLAWAQANDEIYIQGALIHEAYNKAMATQNYLSDKKQTRFNSYHNWFALFTLGTGLILFLIILISKAAGV